MKLLGTVIGSLLAAVAVGKPSVESDADLQSQQVTVNKAPLMVNAIDGIFEEVALAPDQVRNAFMKTLVNGVSSPENSVHQHLEACTGADLYVILTNQLKLVMADDSISKAQKMEILRDWIQKRLNSCTEEVTNQDLVHYSLEMAKAQMATQMDLLKAEGQSYRLNVLEKAQSMVDNIYLEYVNALAQSGSYKDQIVESMVFLVEDVQAKLAAEIDQVSSEVTSVHNAALAQTDSYKAQIAETLSLLVGDVQAKLDQTIVKVSSDVTSVQEEILEELKGTESRWQQALLDIWKPIYEERIKVAPEQIRNSFEWIIENGADYVPEIELPEISVLEVLPEGDQDYEPVDFLISEENQNELD